MTAALRYALYAWILASAVGLVVQLFRRRRFRKSQPDAKVVDESAVQKPSETDPDSSDQKGDLEPNLERGTAGETAPSSPEAESPAPDTPDTGAATANAEVTIKPQTPQPIAELLTGIRLPASLEPIVADGITPSDGFLCLHTREASPEEVGIGLADELERLGYSVMGISEDEAVATRDKDVVSLHIDATPAETAIAGIRLFPMAKTGDVVVEVWTGAGPKPSR